MNSKLKKIFSRKIWRPVSVTFLSVGVVFSVGLNVASENEGVINNALNTTSSYTTKGDENEDTEYFKSSYSSYDDLSTAFKEVCEEVESEGIVMLKNDNNALPLAKGSNVSCVLQTSTNFNYGSSGSGAIDSSQYSDLKTVLEGEGLNVNSTLWNFYSNYYNSNSTNESAYLPTNSAGSDNATYRTRTLPWDNYSDEAKQSISETGGTALFVVGRLSGEGSDVSASKSDGSSTTLNEDGQYTINQSYLCLTRQEREILDNLVQLKANGAIDNIVVLVNTAVELQLDFMDKVDACLWVGNVGITGLEAVAKVLTGTYNPSGRLTDTYAKDNFSSPAMASWSYNTNKKFSSEYADSSSLNASQKYYGVYVEGIYVGYRYYETRYEDKVLGTANVGDYDYSSVVAYPFGYGLSYTSFEYSDYSVTYSADTDEYTVSLKVTNTGSVDGKETVQVYLQKPYTSYDVTNSVEKSSVELVGFTKTDVIKAGESANVTITVDRENFKSYDSNGAKTYILEEGDYYLATGKNAHDALNNILALKGKTRSDGMIDCLGEACDGNAALAKKVGEDITEADLKVYSTSSETGAEITNQLDFADINKYEGKGSNSVTYVSRNNWAGTYPTAAATVTLTDQMKEDLQSNFDMEEDPDAEMPTYGATVQYALVDLRGLDYDDPKWDTLLDQMTYSEQSTLLTNGFYGLPAIESVVLNESSAADGPTGVSSSKGSLSMPSEGIWASSFNTELIKKVGEMLAEDALANGKASMYLPGVNIHRTPFGGRAHEYFSEDSYLSGIAVAAEINGVQSKGVIPAVKHFVFNDEEDNRNGVCIWLNEQAAREIFLKPFEYAVSPDYGASMCIMSSFNRAGCIWTGACSELDEILRDEFGFVGFSITDMASSNGATYMLYNDGFMNGTDVFMKTTTLTNNTELNSWKNSATFAQKIRESCHRILYAYANSAAMNGISSSSKVVLVTPWWKALIIGVLVGSFVIGGCAAAIFVVSYVFDRKNLIAGVDDQTEEKEE